MNRKELDTLWHKAMHDSIRDGEDFTRYHFAALVAAAEREACALMVERGVGDWRLGKKIAAHIRARGDA